MVVFIFVAILGGNTLHRVTKGLSVQPSFSYLDPVLFGSIPLFCRGYETDPEPSRVMLQQNIEGERDIFVEDDMVYQRVKEYESTKDLVGQHGV